MSRLSWNLVVAGLWLVSVAEIFGLAQGDGDAYSRSVALARWFGWQSAVALVAAASVRPVKRWVPEAAKLRRALGLAAASSAILHAAITVYDSPLTLAQQLDDAQSRFGVGALIVLLLLAITSFPRVVVWLRLRSWKELHRLVYVAWLCVLLHAFLSPYAFMPGVLALTFLLLLAGASRFLPRRKLSA